MISFFAQFFVSFFKRLPQTKLPFRKSEKTPQHIAIIMDGNGRWAQSRGLPRVVGHRSGVEALRGIVRACPELGVKYLTVYAFSTENWQRPQEEVGFLLELLSGTIDREVEELNKNQVKLRFRGRINTLPAVLQEKIRWAEDVTQNNTRLLLSIMVSYSGRAEILDAAQALVEAGRKQADLKVDEAAFISHLYTADMPDPDLLIRTGGDWRISNYLLWQLAYTEIYITETFWPDFNRERLVEAIADFAHRQRRFGRL